MTPRIRSLVVAALLGTAVLAGCGDDPDGAGTVSPTSVATMPSAPDPASGAMPAGGGASVGDLIGTGVTGVAVVRAHVVVTGDGARLCDGLRESAPPRCADPSMPVTDVPAEVLDGLRSAGGVRWSDGPLTLGGNVEDGRFRVDQGVLARA